MERFRVRRVALVTLLAMLALVLAGCGGDGEEEAPPETPPAEEAVSGEQLFADQGCGGCHTLAAAGTSGTTGPDLDEALRGQDQAFIRESIVDPNAMIADGFDSGVMPQDFGERLSGEELDALVEYLEQSTNR